MNQYRRAWEFNSWIGPHAKRVASTGAIYLVKSVSCRPEQLDWERSDLLRVCAQQADADASVCLPWARNPRALAGDNHRSDRQ
jgi:hypothetical protein